MLFIPKRKCIILIVVLVAILVISTLYARNKLDTSASGGNATRLGDTIVKERISTKIREQQIIPESKAQVLDEFFFILFQKIETDDDQFILEWIEHSIQLVPVLHTHADENADDLKNRLDGVMERIDDVIDRIGEPITRRTKIEMLKKSDYVFDQVEGILVEFISNVDRIAIHQSLEALQLSEIASQFKEGVQYALHGYERQTLREEIVTNLPIVAAIKDYSERDLEGKIKEYLKGFTKFTGITNKEGDILFINHPYDTGVMIVQGATSFMRNYNMTDPDTYFGNMYRGPAPSEDDYIILSRDEIPIY